MLGLVFGNRPRARAVITAVASAIFTIPSLALFVVIPSIIGTQILDPLNVVIALSLYSTSLLVRTVFDALDAVAPEVLNAAEAMGYSPARRRIFVDLPLAVAPLAAGTRVAAVTNVSLVSVGAVIGVGGLGQLFTSGYQRNYPDQILAGIIMILLLALVFDRAIAVAARLLTPWLHHGAAQGARRGRHRPAAPGSAHNAGTGGRHRQAGRPMINDMLSYFTDAANWAGDAGIPARLGEHLWYSFLAVLAAAVVAFPAGLFIGHTGVGKVVPGLCLQRAARPALPGHHDAAGALDGHWVGAAAGSPGADRDPADPGRGLRGRRQRRSRGGGRRPGHRHEGLADHRCRSNCPWRCR